MILRGDFDLLGEQVLYGVIRAVVAKFQLEGFAAQGQAAQLVTEANAEYRDATDELANIFDSVINRLGIAGPIGKKHAIGTHFQDFFRCGLRRHDADFAVMIDEQAQNVLLNAEIISDYFEIARFPGGSGFAHLLGPGGSGQINRASVPHVLLGATHPAG